MMKKTIRSKEDNKLFPYLGDYLNEYLPLQRNLSRETIDTYRVALLMFLGHLSKSTGKRMDFLGFDDIGKDSVTAFATQCFNGKGLSPKTVNLYVGVVRAFIYYASTRSPMLNATLNELKLVPKKKVPQDETVKYFSKTALKAILASANPALGRNSHRDQVAMIVLYDTGCRNSELTEIKLGDVILDAEEPYILIHGKGGKQRMAPITESAKHLEVYIRRFHKDSLPNNHLFYRKDSSGNHRKLSKYAIIRLVKKHADIARKTCPEIPENVHPHSFRHSRAMHLLDDGASMTEIAHILGHNSTLTTQIYAKASLKMRRDAIERATEQNHPLAKAKVAEERTFSDDEFLISHGIKKN
jgi:site-specific recombinase XerD